VSLKLLYKEIDTPAVALLRFGAMWAVLIPLCLFRGLSLKYDRSDAIRVLFSGFLAMGLYMVLFLEGMSMTSPAEGAIILATSPVLTYIISILVKAERFNAAAMLNSLVAFIGVGLVILGGSSSTGGTVLGNLVIFGSSIVWSGSIVYMKPLLRKYEASQLLALSMPGGAIVMIPFGFHAVSVTHFAAISLAGWLMFLQVSILSGVVGFACYYLGVKQVGPSQTSLYQYFVPPTAMFFAWVLMGKTLAPIQGVGFVILLIGVILTTRARQNLGEVRTST